MVRTKIVATLGPASGSRTVLRKMMVAGLDIVRINFSHGSLKEHLSRVELVRALNRKYRRSIKVLGDLEGYRIRIGELKEPLELKKRQEVWLCGPGAGGRSGAISFDYPGNLQDIRKGAYIFIDDGTIALEVVGHRNGMLRALVSVGGLLKSHKGVNIPDVRLRFSDLTEKDRRDIAFCLHHKFEYIAQSFVRSGADITAVRGCLGRGPQPKVIAKIENREGIRNLAQIINCADGIMIARGDMGVSLPIYEVPIIQKRIIRACRAARKVSITATQMLESMTENLRPTRAEVSDVANAIIDGSSCVMLSAETAVGRYPVETVRMMNQIIKFTESQSRSLGTLS